MKPIAVDLFCGAGGMSEGIIQAGFHIVFSSDINEYVEKTYTNRHEQLGLIQGLNTFFYRKDIRELTGDDILKKISNLEIFKDQEVPEIDVVFGGPPCQGFSNAGRRDKNDPRNMLFKEYLRVINELKPKYVVMENVEGFNSTKLDGFIGVSGTVYPDNSLVPNLLQVELNTIGYTTLVPKVLDASDYGVPQRRRRAIFIAYRNGQTPPNYPEPTTPEENQKVTVLEAIGDLITDPQIKKTIDSSKSEYQVESMKGRTKTIHGNSLPVTHSVYNHDLAQHTSSVKERFSLYKEGESVAALINRLASGKLDLREYPSLLKDLTLKFKDSYSEEEIINSFLSGSADPVLIKALLTKKINRYRFDRNKVAPTVVTLPDDYLIPFENRIPTVREMARLQSFDDSFEFLGKRTTGGSRRKIEVPQYTQVGNAVPPLLAKAVSEKIMEAIFESKKTHTLI
ncbi:MULTISPECIES: DNA cytosine methyltransferase [unclassified Exiguobacterium]|uniref:DNA cytosine methyltransferase n=1 Tax=unclassified Exiguobacterium TaxID=2644629 RepID=UPI001BE55BEA|nr:MULTISPECIES: DNA cytosine methyltransferase [unclassified Exiguobacterium]